MNERGLAHRIACRIQHDGKLHELRRLNIDDAERQPPPRAVDRPPDAGNQYGHKQRKAKHESPRRDTLPSLDRHLERDQRSDESDGDEQAVPNEEIPRVIAGVRARLRHRNRGGVDHHEADGQQ